MSKYPNPCDYEQGQEMKIAALEAENAKLRAVVEAAKKCVRRTKDKGLSDIPFGSGCSYSFNDSGPQAKNLYKALAALKEGEG